MTFEISWQVAVTFFMHVLCFAVGFVFFVNGLGEAVNFMGDHKTAAWEKMVGAIIALVGVFLIGKSLRLF